MNYQNPILPGFHPDPSFCRGEDRYYMVTSSFEYFPGLPLFESVDLVNWQPIGHCITRESQMTFTDALPNALGIYAPTIRQIKGRYYVVCTNVGTSDHGPGNFFLWADDPHGEWSDPIWLDLPGIDPSLLEDDQGQIWYCGAHQGIYLCQLDLTDGSHGPRIDIWQGTGGADPEGPHIYQKDGWYYLLIAEGGTGYGHMVTMARSREITGPYEACPANPLLTNRSLPLSIQGTGHADLMEDENGNWWAVCLGIRPLEEFPKRHIFGRETFLVPVTWQQEWPDFGVNGSVLSEMAGPLPGNPSEVDLQQKAYDFFDDFSKASLATAWNTLCRPRDNQLMPTAKGLAMVVSREEKFSGQTWLGHRLQHLPFEITATFDLSEASAGLNCGLNLFLNPTHRYDLVVEKTATGNLVKATFAMGPFGREEEFFTFKETTASLRIKGDTKTVIFEALNPAGEWQKLTEVPLHYLTTETGGIFTGPYVGLFARGEKETAGKVYCRSFHYHGCFDF